MIVSVLKTFVQHAATGMIVANAGGTIDLPDDMVEERLEGGFIEAEPELLAKMTAPAPDADAPTEPAAVKKTGGRPRKSVAAPAATLPDAPVA